MQTIMFEGRAYKIEPNFEIVCEIEEELGAVSTLADKFVRDKWAVSELVTLVHIVLQYSGRTIDYVELGNKIVNDGVNAYLKFANQFLTSLIYK